MCGPRDVDMCMTLTPGNQTGPRHVNVWMIPTSGNPRTAPRAPAVSHRLPKRLTTDIYHVQVTPAQRLKRQRFYYQQRRLGWHHSISDDPHSRLSPSQPPPPHRSITE
jgi:hypothetical protein